MNHFLSNNKCDLMFLLTFSIPRICKIYNCMMSACQITLIKRDTLWLHFYKDVFLPDTLVEVYEIWRQRLKFTCFSTFKQCTRKGKQCQSTFNITACHVCFITCWGIFLRKSIGFFVSRQ